MTDIPLCIVNVNRDVWYQGNVAFVSMTTDTKVTALTVGGSVDSGYTVLENLVEFVLTMDPPPGKPLHCENQNSYASERGQNEGCVKCSEHEADAIYLSRTGSKPAAWRKERG